MSALMGGKIKVIGGLRMAANSCRGFGCFCPVYAHDPKRESGFGAVTSPDINSQHQTSSSF